jgi:hypothetical protein
MSELLTQYYVSDDLPYSVKFHSLYHTEIKQMIKFGNERFGLPINTCPNEECDCKISQIYPQIMTTKVNDKIFACPFCYKESVYNQAWGYSISTNITDVRTAMGYKFVVYFKNKEDACLFYMSFCPQHSNFMDLDIKEDH